MQNIVILTGAGVSAESGLGTFRDMDGLWTRYDLADVATPEGYQRDPDLVLAFYNARRRNCREAIPNAAHYALARLEETFPGRVTLVTQNIDDLHERAGHREVIHMHGELMKALCGACDHRWGWLGTMSRDDACPVCGAVGQVRPDVVWFGEVPYWMDEIAARLARCKLFLSIGTSGAVYPAAGFVAEASAQGARTLELNLEQSDGAALFDQVRLGPASQTVPAWVSALIDAE
ncbi:MAG: NAD-dependent deacylase [Pseudomonadota bacterium]